MKKVTALDALAMRGPKYSPNLRAYLRKFRGIGHSIENWRVYRRDNRSLWIGLLGDFGFAGSHLMQVVTTGARTGRAFDPAPARGEFKPIKTFWNRYERLGICAIDPKHVHYHHRWGHLNDKRRVCMFCGLVQNNRPISRIVVSDNWVTE